MQIVICGDLLPTELNEENFIKGNIERLFDERIISLFHDCDYSICNLEGPLTNHSSPELKSGPNIKASPDSINGIVKLGVSCLCLANNHIMDYGKQGYIETVYTIKNKGIDYVGSGDNIEDIKKYILFKDNNVTVALYNVCEEEFNRAYIDYPGCNIFDTIDTYEDIGKLKKSVDFVIVTYHGGVEEFRYPSPIVRERFHKFVDAGADFVTAQHSHCVGAYEEYKGATLLYGQGNFQFARAYNEYTKTSLLVELRLDKSIDIKFHLLRRDGGKMLYDSTQCLDDFISRSKVLTESTQKKYEEEYESFCRERLMAYLDIFSGYSLEKRIMKRLLSKEKYEKYLLKRYNNEAICSIINSVRDSDHREVIIKGLEGLLKCNSMDDGKYE